MPIDDLNAPRTTDRRAPHGVLTEEESQNIIHRVHSSIGRDTVIEDIGVWSWWVGNLRWARNRVMVTGDQLGIFIYTQCTVHGGRGVAATNQTDDRSIQGMVRAAERRALWINLKTYPDEMPVPPPPLSSPETRLWSDTTATMTGDERGALAALLSRRAIAHDVLSAGYLEMRACTVARVSTNQAMRYQKLTQSQCSMTVRHPTGSGSGWAGESGYDWAAIDSAALAERALEKCLTSIDPVRISPGRYTAILEPKAVSDLVGLLMKAFARVGGSYGAEMGRGPFTLGYDRAIGKYRSKLGLKVVDERITISHDPTDPELGVWTQPGLDVITWIDRGILTALDQGDEAYGARLQYALPELNDGMPVLDRPAFRMSGGPTSVEQMIATTKRGLLVTRFSDLNVLNTNTLISTGVTRDGLWLIEDGTRSKPVRNMRVTESPLFVLNQVEQLGPPVPVFRPVQDAGYLGILHGITPAIVPPLKVNDFSFTATIDAV